MRNGQAAARLEEAAPLPHLPESTVALDRLPLAIEYHAAGRFDQARDLYLRILAESPGEPVCLHHLGLIAHQLGDHATAADLIEKAILRRPDYPEAYANLGAVLRPLGRTDEAIAAERRAIALNPNAPEAHSNLGSALEDKGEFEEALDAYRTAATLNPLFTDAHSNMANVLRKLGRPREALEVCNAIIARRPDAAAPYVSLGNILRDLHRGEDAIASYRRALALQPGHADAHFSLGNLFLAQDMLPEAVAAFQKALDLKPNFVEAHFNLAATYETMREIPAAMASYRAALAVDPDLLSARFELCHMRRYACDWEGIEAEERVLLELVSESTEAVPPFSITSMDSTPAQQQHVARLWAKRFNTAEDVYTHLPPTSTDRAGRKLRIGYLSADFYRHATANLMVDLFERHDRARFETIAYSHGPDDQSEMRWRLTQAFDRFVDVRTLSDAQVAARIREDGVDILVDLKGYTQGARTQILAHRPAPVQVSHIGFPGTMACDFIDYIIADPFVLPMDQQPYYSENIVHLPQCYQPNDSRRRIADDTPTRMQCGLPDHGFVFCCFNNSFKITPTVFDIWMRLLTAVQGSVLWLLANNELVETNLRREAVARGVAAERLVFAPRVETPDHLARQRLADLFLDTLPYNAHTTTSDALWTGLPVVTCMGTTFAGRVASSLLYAAGMPELVTHSLGAYEALALRLAQEPDLLVGMRQKLLATRLQAPLFDAVAFARDIEAAYDEMWDIWARGEPAKPFAVKPRVTPVVAAPEAPAPAGAIERVLYQACPLCEAVDIPGIIGADCTRHRLYQPGLAPTMSWHACSACDHIFTAGYFDADARRRLDKPEPRDSVGFDMEGLRMVSARRVARVARRVQSGVWLDVGFGNGSLLFTADEWGFTPVGLEVHAANVQALRTLGYEAHEGTLGDLDHPGRFSVVSMVDGFAGAAFPREALAAAHRILRPGGILVLDLPNHDSMPWRLLHANGANPQWGDIGLHHMFSRKRFYALLEASGFAPVEYHAAEDARLAMEVLAVKLPA